MKLVDQSGQVWNVTEEALVNAADSSQTLRRIPTHSSFWFGWYAFYPPIPSSMRAGGRGLP